MNRGKKISAIICLSFLPCLASCSACRHPAPGHPAFGGPRDEARPWTAEGLEHHPEMAALVRSGDPWGLGRRPETGPWREWDSPLLADFGPGGNAGRRHSAALLLHDFAGALPLAGSLGEDLWQSSLRLLPESPSRARGTVYLWGLKDDSVAGVDYLVFLGAENGRWSVTGVRERSHCRRGLCPESGLCL